LLTGCLRVCIGKAACQVACHAQRSVRRSHAPRPNMRAPPGCLLPSSDEHVLGEGCCRDHGDSSSGSLYRLARPLSPAQQAAPLRRQVAYARSAASTRSGDMGMARSRFAVASKMAALVAAAIGKMDGSPAPCGAWERGERRLTWEVAPWYAVERDGLSNETTRRRKPGGGARHRQLQIAVSPPCQTPNRVLIPCASLPTWPCCLRCSAVLRRPAASPVGDVGTSRGDATEAQVEGG